jgi:hypothetical protein
VKLKVNLLSIITSTVFGGCIGFLGGPVFILLPWAVIGLIIGGFNETKKSALINGAAYGFTIAYVFMLSGYRGSASITTVLLPFVLLGLIGGICGLILTIIGYLIANRKANKI